MKRSVLWVTALIVGAALAGCSVVSRAPAAADASAVPPGPRTSVVPPTAVPNRAAPSAVAACPQPCWEGLRPGISRLDDVQQYLQSRLNERERVSAIYAPRQTQSCSVFAWRTIQDNRLQNDRLREIYVEDGVLRRVRMEVPRGWSLQEVIEQFGAPEYVWSLKAIGPDGSGYFLEVFYPQQGLVFELHPDLDKIGVVTPQLDVRTVEYVQPGNLNEFLLHRYACVFSDPAVQRRQAQDDAEVARPWTGYGEVEIVEHR